MKRIILFTGFILSQPVILLANWQRGCWNAGFFGFGGHHGGGGVVMWILTVIILGFLIFFGVKYFQSSGGEVFKRESSIDILKSRYAKGEISKEEFEEMKKIIS